MDVVGCASNAYYLATSGVDKSTDIIVQPIQMLFFNGWACGLYVKDNV